MLKPSTTVGGAKMRRAHLKPWLLLGARCLLGADRNGQSRPTLIFAFGKTVGRALLILATIGSAACTIAAGRPNLLVEVVPIQAAVEVDASSISQEYEFSSWLSFPAVGPWTYEVGKQFDEYVASFKRQVVPTAGPGPSFHLRLTLTSYDVSTFYQASCSVRATLVEGASSAALLNKQYVAIGRSAVQRVGWFGFLGIRSALRATTATAFDQVFARIATDVAGAIDQTQTIHTGPQK